MRSNKLRPSISPSRQPSRAPHAGFHGRHHALERAPEHQVGREFPQRVAVRRPFGYLTRQGVGTFGQQGRDIPKRGYVLHENVESIDVSARIPPRDIANIGDAPSSVRPWPGQIQASSLARQDAFDCLTAGSVALGAGQV